MAEAERSPPFHFQLSMGPRVLVDYYNQH